MSESELPVKRKQAKPRKKPRYGEIPGLPVGTRWDSREAMYEDGFHLSLQAGIQGRGQEGASSVILSGGYEDDVDLGDEFTYTGSGGQKHRSDKDRSQQKDQEWKGGNLALKMSCNLRKPVRVIRGFRLNSTFAPSEGYRYDGLYYVTEFDRKPGKSGPLVCLFKFVRCPNQLPLPGIEATHPMRRKNSRILPSSSTRLSSSSRSRSAGSSIVNDVTRPMFVQGSSSSSGHAAARPTNFATRPEPLKASTPPIKVEEVDLFDGSEEEGAPLKDQVDDDDDDIYMDDPPPDAGAQFPPSDDEDDLKDAHESDIEYESELEEGEIREDPRSRGK